MTKPIRRDLLIHTVTYNGKPTHDPWGNGVTPEPVQVEHVRVEPKTKLSVSGVGAKVESDTLLFWDAVHSTPVQFEEGATLLFNGRELTIVGVDEYYGKVNLHHVEVRCA